MRDIASGVIVMWFGALASIPNNWALCNGANGTPDLRDRFVPGAGTTYDPADTGGNVLHGHNFTAAAHNHEMSAGSTLKDNAARTSTTSNAVTSGTTNDSNGLPAYHSLAYIMRL